MLLFSAYSIEHVYIAQKCDGSGDLGHLQSFYRHLPKDDGVKRIFVLYNADQKDIEAYHQPENNFFVFAELLGEKFLNEYLANKNPKVMHRVSIGNLWGGDNSISVSHYEMSKLHSILRGRSPKFCHNNPGYRNIDFRLSEFNGDYMRDGVFLHKPTVEHKNPKVIYGYARKTYPTKLMLDALQKSPWFISNAKDMQISIHCTDTNYKAEKNLDGYENFAAYYNNEKGEECSIALTHMDFLPEEEFDQLFASGAVGICGGDNTLQKLISEGVFPLYVDYWGKAPSIKGLGALITDYPHEPNEELLKENTAQIFLTNYKDMSLLTAEVIDFWHNKICPWLRKHHNYRKKVLRFETQSEHLWHLILGNEEDFETHFEALEDSGLTKKSEVLGLRQYLIENKVITWSHPRIKKIIESLEGLLKSV